MQKLKQEILSLLEDQEPNMLKWSEIVGSLWTKKYHFQYKEKKDFGTVASRALNLLKAEQKIKHEDLFYGTLNSNLPRGTSKRLSSQELELLKEIIRAKAQVQAAELLAYSDGERI